MNLVEWEYFLWYLSLMSVEANISIVMSAGVSLG